jgi:hypothetical protein
MTAARDWTRNRAQATLYIAGLLGAKPRGWAAEQAAAAHAADALLHSTDPIAPVARRLLAIEFLATMTGDRVPGREDYEGAIARVDATTDETDLASVIRGGVMLEAIHIWRGGEVDRARGIAADA